jgi:hypothetical protein
MITGRTGNFGQYLERISGDGPLCVRFLRHCDGMEYFIGEFRCQEIKLRAKDYSKHVMKTVYESGSRVR